MPRADPPDQQFIARRTVEPVAFGNGPGMPPGVCNVHTEARSLALRYDVPVATSETLRSVIDAGRTTKRLDELSTARVIGKIAEQLHAAQQKAGAGKAIGPITPSGISLERSGAAKLGLAEPTAVTYSSPEQIATTTSAIAAADVFSLSVVMCATFDPSSRCSPTPARSGPRRSGRRRSSTPTSRPSSGRSA